MSAKKHTFTLGIEEEFAIIDPQTRELRSHIQEILEGGKVVLKEQIKPEMHQSARIPFHTGATSRSHKATVTRKSCATCSCWRARTSFSDCTCMSAFPIA